MPTTRTYGTHTDLLPRRRPRSAYHSFTELRRRHRLEREQRRARRSVNILAGVLERVGSSLSKNAVILRSDWLLEVAGTLSACAAELRWRTQ